MMNMFSENKEKSIPKNLRDCYKTDKIVNNLWLWCERLEKWGQILFWILIVFGSIISIFNFVNSCIYLYAEVGIDCIGDFFDEFGEVLIQFGQVVSKTFSFAVYAFIEYFIYHIIALLIGSLASMVRHTKITANMFLYSYANTHADEIQEEIKQEEKIKRQKIEYEKKKTEEIKKRKEAEKAALKLMAEKKQQIYDDMIENIVFCENCGADISNDEKKCHVCGVEF